MCVDSCGKRKNGLRYIYFILRVAVLNDLKWQCFTFFPGFIDRNYSLTAARRTRLRCHPSSKHIRTQSNEWEWKSRHNMTRQSCFKANASRGRRHSTHTGWVECMSAATPITTSVKRRHDLNETDVVLDSDNVGGKKKNQRQLRHKATFTSRSITTPLCHSTQWFIKIKMCSLICIAGFWSSD